MIRRETSESSSRSRERDETQTFQRPGVEGTISSPSDFLLPLLLYGRSNPFARTTLPDRLLEKGNGIF